MRSSGLDAVLDDAQAVLVTCPSVTYFECAVSWSSMTITKLTRLLGADGDIRQQQAFIRRRTRHAHAREHPGVKTFDLKYCTPADRARRAVDHVVNEVHAAFVVETLVNQLDGDLHASIPARDILAGRPTAGNEDTKLRRM